MNLWKQFEREAERARLLALLSSGHPDEARCVIDDRAYTNDNVPGADHAATNGLSKAGER